MPLASGARLGPYQILALIGQGGMGQVYRATDTRLGRDVAIKVLTGEFARDPERLARFEREARVLASLNHPNIAAIYGFERGFEQADSVPFLVLEYVPGETIRGPLAIEDVLAIARQIADALEAAHEKGVVHRDLKPANVKITPEGKVKVLDFGLAKALAADPATADPSHSPTLSMAATRAGTILGTAAYMSPEQARGRPIDKRTDIWAFGCVLYELLSGRQAFGGDDVVGTLAAVVRAEPDWSALPAATPPGVRTLLGRCLEKDAARRLRDIGDARFEMDEAPAETTTAPSRPGLGWPRLGWVVAALCAAAAVAVWVTGRRPGPAPAAPIRFTLYPPERGIFESGPVVSPDGRSVAFAASTASRKTSIWVRPLDSSEPRALPGTEEAFSPFWSPDSRSLGYFTVRKVMRVDIAGGSSQAVSDVLLPIAGAWSPSGVILVSTYSLAGRALQRVNAAGGSLEPATKLDAALGEFRHLQPRFLPDGRQFLYTTLGPKPGVYLASLDSGASRLVTAHTGSAHVAGSAGGYLMWLRDGKLWAQPVDASLKAAGDLIALADSAGSFSASNNGVLAWWAGGGDAEYQLGWFDRTGKRLGIVGPGTHFEISPDGGKVAFDRDDRQSGVRNIWLYDQSRGTASRLTLDRGGGGVPAWSPDGRRIVFSSQRSGRDEVYQVPAGGGGKEEPLGGGPAHHKHWSPAGRYLAYDVQGPKSGYDVWVVPLKPDGSVAAGKPEPFLNSEFSESQPQFSPDGKWLAYISDETGRFEVYVQSFPEKRGKWTISTAGGVQPRWRRDGKELYYLAADRKMMVTDVKTGPAGFEAGVPRALFETNFRGDDSTVHFAMTGDAQRFLMRTPAGESRPEPATVVVNWEAMLKR